MLPSYAWFWDKKDKALEAEMQGKGYAGTLPDLSSKVKEKEQKVIKPVFESQKSFDDPEKLKPAPKDNPTYIDIIQKKDKISEYIEDINLLIPMLEKLLDSIEEDEGVQLFVTKANCLTLNLDHIAEKYLNKPESFYLSFKKMMEVNGYIKTIVELRQEAIKYQRYLAYQTTGSIYNPENISQQLQYLAEEINNAILLLKQEE